MSSHPAVKNALKTYGAVSVHSGVEGATPHRLVQMLMQGVLEKIAFAKGHMERGEIAQKGNHISWAISIIEGLRASLDIKAGKDVAQNLNALYAYMETCLIDANLRNEPKLLDEVSNLLVGIKAAWDAIPAKLDNSSATT